MERNTVKGGSVLVYRKIGEGKPLVLLHGFCAHSHLWDPLLISLDDEYSLLVPDLPGFGKSPVPEGPYMKVYADAVFDMLDKEDIDRAVVIGHSMGGYVALEMAAARPERIEALGLVHSHPYADSEAQRDSRQKAIRVVNEKGAAFYIKQFIPGLFHFTTDRLIVKATIASLEKQSAEGLVAGQQAMLQREDRSGVLEKASFPVLVLQGAHDLLIPPDRRYAQAALPAQCMVHTLPMSAHMGMIEQPRECANTINRFLELLD